MATTKKTVIITGAAGGLGSAMVKAYLKRGYNVIANGLNIGNLEKMATTLGNPKSLLFIQGDIAKPETAQTLFKKAIEAFGKVDILINNAGVFIAKPIESYTIEDVDIIINTNLKGFFYPSQIAAKHMFENGSGHIITITAAIAMQPNIKVPALLPILIKGGLNNAVRGLALELASSNIQVNAVAPGIIDTPLHGSINNDNARKILGEMSPSGRIGEPQDIVDAVLYLTDSNFVTGTIIPVDGGSTAGTW